MAETQITRCPHCQTTFRIRLEQLATAKGAVRCGSCLQVFKAADHFVSEKPKATQAKPAAQAKSAAKPASAKTAAPKTRTPQNKTTVSTQATTSKITPPTKTQTIPKPEKKTEDISFDDIPDQIADDPLEDFGIRQPERDSSETFDNGLQLDDSVFSMQDNAKPSRYSLNDQSGDFDFEDDFSSDSFGSSSSSNSSDESWASGLIDDENDTPTAKNNADDESWADALLDTDDDLIEDIDMSFTKANVAKEEDDFLPSLEDDAIDDQFHLGGDDELEQKTVEIELTIADSVNDLLDEPLNFDAKNKQATAKAQGSNFVWLWFTGAIIMMLVMVIQVSYFKFDSWSRHPDYRSSYALACQVIGCKLPAIQDINKMNTQHFMVRLHPEIEQALYIDTLLVNSAPYRQPFPDLNLVFTGLENQIIASRTFKPKEYLAGELAGATEMPLNVPIHIAFEIINPGAEAVSYRIELASNQ